MNNELQIAEQTNNIETMLENQLNTIEKQNQINEKEAVNEAINTISTTVNTIQKIETSNEDLDISKTDVEFNDFKENAINYFVYDDEIKKLTKKAKELRKKKLDCTKQLLEYMGDNDIKNINTDNGKLKYVMTKQKEKMNNAYIKKKLAAYFNSDEKALDCFKFIDKRGKIDVPKLRRCRK